MKWSEVFLILEIFGLKRYDVYAEHDVVYVNLTPEQVDDIVSSDYWPQLEEFGFIHGEENGVLEINV